VNIGDRHIGPGHAPYLIAEIGVNHDGSPARAVELVRAARDAGADAVKFQLFETDRLMSRAAKLAAYQKNAGETDPFAMLRRLELTAHQLAPAVERARELGLHAIVTVFSVELVSLADSLPWDAYKSASPDLINRPLLDAAAGTGAPLIVSTGASTLDEVARAARWLDHARGRLAMLQCVSSYPAPDDALAGIPAIAHATGLPTGYSDHTPSVETGAEAVRCGACILEKHLTYDTRAQGPDHAASLDAPAFARYAELARRAAPGSRTLTPDKRILDCERDVRAVSRQSIVASRALRPGDRITRDALTIKRPGTGLEPWRVDEIIGRKAARPVNADMPLVAEDLS
jgi:sialic acid synthase SpsE